MDDWCADIEVEPLSEGGFRAVLVLRPPTDLGPPLRHVLEGKFSTEAHARLGAQNVFDAMSEKPTQA